MKVLILDWETTGLTLHPLAKLPLQPRAIEFGGVMLEDGAVTAEVSVLINPEQEVSAEITKITGLTNADLNGQPTFAAAWPLIELLFKDADGMIAHNLPFDRSVLAYELERMGVKEFRWPRGLCTAQTYQDLFGKRPRLLELYEEIMGVPLAQTHRALDDCKALAEIVIKQRLWELV
jgi:DNA polymerase-3 subunit epsilon